MGKLRIFLYAAAAACLIASCAKSETTGVNDANKRYFDAWLKINHPDAVRDGLGIYIIDETVGTGKEAGSAEDYPYALVSYTTTDLEGTVSETTEAKVAQQIGTYDATKYYGPVIRLRNSTAMTAGQEMTLNPMRVGGTRKAVIPGWFNTTTTRATTEDGYLENVTGDNVILTLTLHDVIKDLSEWQIDSISSYLAHNYPSPVDSTKYGFYYIQTKAPDDTTPFASEAKVYVNYTGRLLNGTVFDSSDEKTMKDAGLHKAGKTYSPLSVTMKEDYTEIEEVIPGFALCVSNMKKGEKGTCIFYSELGYKGSAQSNIPAYSPLRFDVEMLGTSSK